MDKQEFNEFHSKLIEMIDDIFELHIEGEYADIRSSVIEIGCTCYMLGRQSRIKNE